MIKSFTLNNTSDSILSRICLVSLIWLLLILGGFSSRAWGKQTTKATVTIISGKGTVSLKAQYKPNIWTTTDGST